MEPCPHHSGIIESLKKLCAEQGRRPAQFEQVHHRIDIVEKETVSMRLFMWVIGGITGLGLLIAGIVYGKASNNTECFHQIKTDIAVIAEKIKTQEQRTRHSSRAFRGGPNSATDSIGSRNDD